MRDTVVPNIKQDYFRLLGIVFTLNPTPKKRLLSYLVELPETTPQFPYEVWSELLKGGYMGGHIVEYYSAFRGDTRSLDYSS